ncbi:hypothetical protein DFH07DRAFT_807729 [Mycena maculata]|uniref:Uncharacterized protein n=1 Tax=Mycena maculata TaxID=230809 RepID=A0AAD7JR92_9AGAR|nr:hypothetical protein DFH07DRAFT_807729 [Mycena maculata]
MGRWTQDTEDAERLPEGMKRIGYDMETARYKFCDREGNLYMGPANEEYGQLTLVAKKAMPPSVGTNDRLAKAFSSDSRSDLSVEIEPPESGPTFQDILPPHMIASPLSPLATSPTSEVSPGSRFRDAVRRTTLPSMQSVVNNVRRATTIRKPRDRDREKDGLLRNNSQTSSAFSRSKTPAGIVSSQSKHEKSATL